MASTVLSTAEETTIALIEQIRTCVSASWAVAWATPNEVFDAAIARIEVFEYFVVGIHGCNTHPECLRNLGKYPTKAFIRRNDRGALFHPKLYIFEHADCYTVVIGSHNMTNGAFGTNVEVSMLTDFPKDDTSVVKLLAWIKDAAYPGSCVPYSTTWISDYERLYKVAQDKRKEIDSQLQDFPNSADVEKFKSLPINLSWPQWFERVCNEKAKTHTLDERLHVLEYIGALFKTHSYGEMERVDRMRVCGLASVELCRADKVDWKFFGNMMIAGGLLTGYRDVVLDNPEQVSKALELLPRSGLVTEQDWKNYWTEMRRIDAGRGLLGRGTATRFACLRRPDVFVTLNDANAGNLAKLLGRPQSDLKDGETYWTTVIRPIQKADWYTAGTSQPPYSTEARAWRARAALLDALIYE